MNVAILGAGGTIAPVIVADLAISEEVDHVLLLDLDQQRAAEVGELHGGGKTSAEAADARRGLAWHLEGVDLLINSASYRVNLDAMRACLEAGCNYVDLGGLYWLTRRQLELHEQFERAGLLGLLGIGSSPGKTNLMAAAVVAELGGQADRIDVAAAGRDLQPGVGLSVPYALQTLLDELTMAPVVLEGGKPVELEPLAPGGAVDYGEPIGEEPTIYTLHSELATFGESFGCRESGFRLSLSPRLETELRGLVGALPEEVEAFAAATVPASPHTVSVHRVDVHGGGRHVAMRAVTSPYAPFGVGGSVVSTAAPAAAYARLLARGAVQQRGVHPPERCIDPQLMFAELEQRGCEFETREL